MREVGIECGMIGCDGTCMPSMGNLACSLSESVSIAVVGGRIDRGCGEKVG